MLDYVIRSGTLIDGTGERGRAADVGIRDSRIVAIGQVEEQAATELDAAGLMVAPGVIALTRMWSRASRNARTLVIWCRPALLAL